MARKPMVTRTIKTTKVNVLCLDIMSAEPFNKEFILPRTFTDDRKLFKAVESVITEANIKPVHVVAKTEVETLYGMSEQDFIAHATELDPATRKMLEAENESEAEN